MSRGALEQHYEIDLLAAWREQFGLIAGVAGAPSDFSLDRPDSSQTWSSLVNHPAVSGMQSVHVSRQVHGNTVEVIHPTGPGPHTHADRDGHIAAHEGCLLGVTVADCVPVFLAATTSNVFGIVHAGWRGAAAGILQAALVRFEELGVSAEQVAVHLGPSICGECYEVGPEVFSALGLDAPSHPTPLDLRGVLATAADRLGVRMITRSTACTREDPRLHSYRRDGHQSGRMAAFVGRPLA